MFGGALPNRVDLARGRHPKAGPEEIGLTGRLVTDVTARVVQTNDCVLSADFNPAKLTLDDRGKATDWLNKIRTNMGADASELSALKIDDDTTDGG